MGRMIFSAILYRQLGAHGINFSAFIDKIINFIAIDKDLLH